MSELAEIANNTIAIKEDSTKPKVSLSFELNRSHILKLTKVSAEIIETLVTEVKPKEGKKKDEKKDEDKKDEDNKTDDDKKDESKESEEKKEGDTPDKKEDEPKDGEKKPEADAVVEEPKKEYKTTKVPHTYSVAIKEKLHSVNLLDDNQVKEAKARIRALEKRDEDKFKNESAKNTFETLIYEFRGFLNEEENNAFTEEKDREAHIEKTRTEEEWLDDEGSNAGYKVYQDRTYDLKSKYSKIKNLKL